ncbi:hypothetical protein F7R05_06260 [Pseudomonas koreensis]|nr:hypothetical protein F7R05_06260 [Pseudomonas koreensis]
MVADLSAGAGGELAIEQDAGIDQKIAGFGSACIGMHSSVGAAEGCDLLIFKPLRSPAASLMI